MTEEDSMLIHWDLLFLLIRLKMIRFNVLFFTVYFLCSFALAQEPVAIDSRIKTFIYTKNQVFKIDANYGYQSKWPCFLHRRKPE